MYMIKDLRVVCVVNIPYVTKGVTSKRWFPWLVLDGVGRVSMRICRLVKLRSELPIIGIRRTPHLLCGHQSTDHSNPTPRLYIRVEWTIEVSLISLQPVVRDVK
jgi:hypothetical protein